MEKTLLANRYKVLKKLGEGGMGKIWQVYDTVEKRELALKQVYKKDTLTPETAEASQKKRITLSTIATESAEADLRFKQEFRTMVKLRHPNTVNVYDYGVLENGDDYITMEIVSGGELSDIIKERQLTLKEIYKFLIQICQVLNFIHSRLLVHRDIKPENIRITPDGNVKMMDFGLMDQMGLPSNGQITGTIAYLPPEVAQGGIIDVRSDLYSLGCLAYELVAGHPPFTAPKIIEVIKKHLSETPEPLKEARPDCPKELEEIILKLLAKNQNDRYQSTSELLNDLVPLSGEKFTIETLEQRKSYLNCSELIGRDKEIQKLKDAFSLATQGKGQGIFIAAPAGVGKSRLIQEFKLKVQLAEIPYLEGQCFEQGMTLYQPLADAFKLLLPLVKKEVIDKYGSVLVKIIPQLLKGGYEHAPQLDEYAEKVRLFENVTGWLKEVSKVTPIVICIEDLHWSDYPTLELLNVCIRELKDYPVMFLCAFRDDEVEPTSIIFQTEEEGLAHIMRLSTLSEENVSFLIKGMLGRIELTEEFTEHIFTATAGNAFFVSEAMRALIEEEQLKLERGCWILPADVSTLELPTSIEGTIIRRLNLLNPEALKLARIASVVGRRFDLTFLKSLIKLDDEKLFEILDELIERQFMRIEEKQYLFTHDRVRETLYGQLSKREKQKFHEQSGCILEERHAENLQAITIELAYHFSRGLDQQKAIKYLLLAGDTLYQKKALTEATGYLAQADKILEFIDYPNKEMVLLKLRDQLIEASNFPNPKLSYETAEKQLRKTHSLANIPWIIKMMRFMFKVISFLPLKLSDKIKKKLLEQKPIKETLKKPDVTTLVMSTMRALGYSINAYFCAGDIKKSVEISERFLNYLPDFNSLPFVLLSAGTIGPYIQTGQNKTYLERLKKAMNILERIKMLLQDRFELFVYALIYFEYSKALTVLGRKYSESSMKKSLSLCKEYNFFDIEMFNYTASMEWYSYCGRSKEFQKSQNQAIQISKRMGRPTVIEVFVYEAMTRFALNRRDLVSAEESCNKLINLSLRQNYVPTIIWGKIFYATLLFEKGKTQEAISTLEDAAKITKEQRLISQPAVLYQLAEIYLESGNLSKVKDLLEEAQHINNTFEMEFTAYTVKILRALGKLHRKEKQFEKARDYYNQSLSIARENDLTIEEGFTHLELAKLYADLTKYTAAKQEFQNAENKFLEIESKYLLKKTKELMLNLVK